MKKFLGWAFAILVVVGVVGYNAYKEQNLTNKKRIYAILPITGGLSFQGKEEKKTMEVWMQNHPDAPFELEILDNESNPTKSLTLAQRAAMNDKEPLFICPIGAMCHPIVPQLESMNGFMILSPSTQEEDGTYKRFQRISFGAKDMCQPAFDYIKENQTVTAICANSEAAHAAVDLLKKDTERKGAKVISKYTFESQELDTRITVLKAISDKPDVIFVTGVPSIGFVNIIKELKRQDYRGKVLADPTLRTPSIVNQLGKNAEGVFTSIMSTERIYKEYPQVAKALEESGLELYNFPINVWDIMDVMNHFISNNIPFKQDEFLKMAKWHGISSDITFMPNGNSAYEFMLAIVKDGKFIPVKK